jgi:rSAM/selenodomain-associated transferase 2
MVRQTHSVSFYRPPSADLSIVVPVLGEKALIRQTLDHLQNLAINGRREIIVVDGDRRAGTIAALDRPGVTGVTSPTGRAIQMNAGAAIASGRVLVFAHADTRLPPQALSLIMAAIDRRQAAAGAFGLGIASDRPGYRLIEAAATWRSRSLDLPYGDQAIFVKKNVFRALDGFRPIPLMEDVDLMRRLKKTGARIVVLSEKVATSARRWEKEGPVYTTLRNWALLTLFLAGVPPERLVRWYPPHRSAAPRG